MPSETRHIEHRECEDMRQNDHIILGIDPGYARMGWGVIKIGRGSCAGHILEVAPTQEPRPTLRLECLGFGCVETPKEEEMPTRLAYLFDALKQIMGHYKPNDIAVEELFFAKNVKTAMLVAHARGVIMMASALHSGRIFEYRPNDVKLAVAGDRKADKKAVIQAVCRALDFDNPPKLDDVADALAIALTHAGKLVY